MARWEVRDPVGGSPFVPGQRRSCQYPMANKECEYVKDSGTMVWEVRAIARRGEARVSATRLQSRTIGAELKAGCAR